jgi:hypothetical protein
LLLRLSAGHRHDGASETFGTVVRAEPAREQAIAVSDVHDVAAPTARRTNRSRHEQCPRVDVLLRVTDDRRLARRTARRVNTHDLLARHSEHAERIVGAQVVFYGEWKLREIIQRAQVMRVHARRAEALAIVGDILVGVLQGPLQTLQLQGAQLVDAGGFDRLEIHGSMIAPPISCDRPRKSATHSPF